MQGLMCMTGIGKMQINLPHYTPKSVTSQTTQQLSVQAKLELRRLGLGYFAFFLDSFYSASSAPDGAPSADCLAGGDGFYRGTAKQFAQITGWSYSATYRALIAGKEYFTQITPELNTRDNTGVKSEKYSVGQPAKVFVIPDSDEIDRYLSIAEPLYLIHLRLDSYMHYKADVSQIPVVESKPGELSSHELAERTHVSRKTHYNHRQVAETKSFTDTGRAKANREEMPENYGEFLGLIQRFSTKARAENPDPKAAKIGNMAILPSLHLEYQGENYAYSQREYDRLVSQGADPEKIQAVWYRNSHHYARPELVVKGKKYTEYSVMLAPVAEQKKYYYVPEYLSPEPVLVFDDWAGEEVPMPPAPGEQGLKGGALQRILEQMYGAELAGVLMEAK